MTHPKTTGKNKTTNLNIETVEDPANSTVNKEGANSSQRTKG